MGMTADQAGTMLPLVVLWPLLAAAAGGVLAKSGCSRRGFDVFVILAAGLALAGVAGLIAPVLAESRLVGALPFGRGRIEFAADPVGVMFALAAALVWFCATLYATAWLRQDAARARFQITSLVLLSANLGVVLAADLITLYICFEVLGIVALLLVVHDGTETARRAGVKYFWMTLLGGISLLAGILLFHALTGSIDMSAAPRASDGSPLMWATFILLLVGFGVKAGMVPLHIWLPDAHPVAPPPASALLSGVMIKTGAYGIFRVLNVLFSGGPAAADQAPETLQPWVTMSDMGLVVMWLGLATMLIGVVLALGQRQAKRMLAWHSVSQMGFVLTGLGTGAYLGADGAMASAGGLLHVFNHGLFKGALFLGAGAVAMRTGTANMYRLGGLWRKMPVTFGCMLAAAAGITGVPLFNGFVSKCMIHHGLVEAAERGGGLLLTAEWIFLATCAGTFASFVKLIGLVFVRKPETGHDATVREAPAPMQAGMLILVVPIVVIGVRPQWLLEGLIAPGLSLLGIPADPIAYFLSHYFLSAADFGSFSGMAIAGAVLFIVGMRYGLFHLHAPGWVGVDYWYRAAGNGVLALCRALSGNSARIRARVSESAADAANRLIALLHRAERFAERHEDRAFERLDRLRDRVREKAEDLARDRADKTPGPAHEERINAAHWISGLLATQLLEQAMHSFAGTDDREAVEKWLSSAEARTEDLAQSSLEFADAWVGGSEITATALQSSLRKMLPRLPPQSDIAGGTGRRDWIGELGALIFRPGEPHWPVTESLDRGRLAAWLRRYLEGAARNLDLALGLVFALLALLLLRLVY